MLSSAIGFRDSWLYLVLLLSTGMLMSKSKHLTISSRLRFFLSATPFCWGEYSAVSCMLILSFSNCSMSLLSMYSRSRSDQMSLTFYRANKCAYNDCNRLSLLMRLFPLGVCTCRGPHRYVVNPMVLLFLCWIFLEKTSSIIFTSYTALAHCSYTTILYLDTCC